MSESAPAWETSKENVLPVKRGRSAKGLSDALSKPKLHSEQENLARIADFDSELQNCPTEEAYQRLDIYIKYIKWVRDAYPGSAERVFELLEVRTPQHSLSFVNSSIILIDVLQFLLLSDRDVLWTLRIMKI